jgi:1,4-alpha-glucan branching enzyme
MNRQQPRKGTLGRKRVEFRLDRPRAQAVSVAGDFNQWDFEAHPMRRNKNGVWTKVAMVFSGRYEYRFYADGQWCNDPGNPQKCANGFGSQNDIIVVPP